MMKTLGYTEAEGFCIALHVNNTDKETSMQEIASPILPPIVFLKGPRVTLRPVLREDIPLLMRYMNDPEVLHFLGNNLPKMEADEVEWFEGLPKRKTKDIVLALVAEEKFIGVVGVHGIDAVNRTATGGAFIGDKHYWSRGYGFEAEMLCLKFAFDTLNLRKVCADVIVFNGRSAAAFMKCGGKEEGRKREHVYRDGAYWDLLQFAVFRGDWLPIWEAFAEKHSMKK